MVGAKYELAPDHVESATSSVRVGAEYEHCRTLVVESTPNVPISTPNVPNVPSYLAPDSSLERTLKSLSRT